MPQPPAPHCNQECQDYKPGEPAAPLCPDRNSGRGVSQPGPLSLDTARTLPLDTCQDPRPGRAGPLHLNSQGPSTWANHTPPSGSTSPHRIIWGPERQVGHPGLGAFPEAQGVSGLLPWRPWGPSPSPRGPHPWICPTAAALCAPQTCSSAWAHLVPTGLSCSPWQPAGLKPLLSRLNWGAAPALTCTPSYHLAALGAWDSAVQPPSLVPANRPCLAAPSPGAKDPGS